MRVGRVRSSTPSGAQSGSSWDVDPVDLPQWIADYQGLTLKGKTSEEIQRQIAALAAHVKVSKTQAQLVAGAVVAGLLYLAARS